MLETGTLVRFHPRGDEHAIGHVECSGCWGESTDPDGCGCGELLHREAEEDGERILSVAKYCEVCDEPKPI